MLHRIFLLIQPSGDRRGPAAGKSGSASGGAGMSGGEDGEVAMIMGTASGGGGGGLPDAKQIAELIMATRFSGQTRPDKLEFQHRLQGDNAGASSGHRLYPRTAFLRTLGGLPPLGGPRRGRSGTGNKNGYGAPPPRRNTHSSFLVRPRLVLTRRLHEPRVLLPRTRYERGATRGRDKAAQKVRKNPGKLLRAQGRAAARDLQISKARAAPAGTRR